MSRPTPDLTEAHRRTVAFAAIAAMLWLLAAMYALFGPVAPRRAAGEPPADAYRVPVNTADVWELQLLPGIGPVTAAALVADRRANGPFTGSENLQRVNGIGPKTAARAAPYISFDAGETSAEKNRPSVPDDRQ